VVVGVLVPVGVEVMVPVLVGDAGEVGDAVLVGVSVPVPVVVGVLVGLAVGVPVVVSTAAGAWSSSSSLSPDWFPPAPVCPSRSSSSRRMSSSASCAAFQIPAWVFGRNGSQPEITRPRSTSTQYPRNGRAGQPTNVVVGAQSPKHRKMTMSPSDEANGPSTSSSVPRTSATAPPASIRYDEPASAKVWTRFRLTPKRLSERDVDPLALAAYPLDHDRRLRPKLDLGAAKERDQRAGIADRADLVAGVDDGAARGWLEGRAVRAKHGDLAAQDGHGGPVLDLRADLSWRPEGGQDANQSQADQRRQSDRHRQRAPPDRHGR
jgi:hypothetical protein